MGSLTAMKLEPFALLSFPLGVWPDRAQGLSLSINCLGWLQLALLWRASGGAPLVPALRQGAWMSGRFDAGSAYMAQCLDPVLVPVAPSARGGLWRAGPEV